MVTVNIVSSPALYPVQSSRLASGGRCLKKLVAAISRIVRFFFAPFFCFAEKISPKKVIPMILSPSILSFYQGGKNDRGDTLEAIWKWDDETLESRHDFIQWLFPLKTKSAFNATAATTNEKTIRAFKQDKTLRDKLIRSLDCMLAFYGLKREGKEIKIASTFTKKAMNWLNPGNHNFLRITRILHSLNLHGLEDEAKGFYTVLTQIYHSHSSKIGAETFGYWTGAATG